MARENTATPPFSGFLVGGSWRRHLGPRAQLVTAAILGLVVAGTFGYALLARSYSPEGAIRDYLAARDRGDVDAVWAATVIDSQVNADASLLDKPALRAVLANPANRHSYPGWTVHQARTGVEATTVDVSYREGAAVRHLSLRARPDTQHHQLGVFPRWQVVLVPSAFAVTLPNAVGPLTVDGLPVKLAPARLQTVAIFAGSHRLEMGDSALFNPTSLDFQAPQPLPAVTSVALELKLTDQARTAAGAALKEAFATCVATTSLTTKGCPQGVIDTSSGPARWNLIGDPTAGASYLISETGGIIAQGHYQMEASYQGSSRAQHKAVAGGYKAELSWDGQKFSAPPLNASTTVPAASRPVVEDSAVKDLVKAASTAA
jgi:hypothetical protein